jgi:hypothetical protein
MGKEKYSEKPSENIKSEQDPQATIVEVAQEDLSDNIKYSTNLFRSQEGDPVSPRIGR